MWKDFQESGLGVKREEVEVKIIQECSLGIFHEDFSQKASKKVEDTFVPFHIGLL